MPVVQALARRMDALISRLSTPRMQRLVIAGALLLAASSVGPHRALDDFVLSLIARGRGAPLGLARGRLDLFTFTTGDPAGNHRLMDVGLMLPWWTDPHLKIAFFRPISSATHWLDEWLWPSSPALMHVHSLAWFGVLLTAAASVYRRIDGAPRAAGLAFLLYAFDDAHGPVLAWLANRNALIAGALGAAALVAHDVWRRRRSWVFGVVAPLTLLAGLLAGELAIGAVGYLVAYAVLLDEGTLRRRLGTLAPTLATVAAWRVSWLHGGYGAQGSGAYIDPLGDPLAFATELPLRFAVLLHGQFSAPPSDLAFLSPPSHRPLLVGIALLTVALVVWLLLPILSEDRTARFWALGMVLSLLPLGATFPSDRLLIFVGLGACGLLGRLFDGLVTSVKEGTLARNARTVLTGCFFTLHVLVAPLLLPVRAGQMELFALAHDRGSHGISEAPDIAGRTVVIVAAPTVLFANYIQAEREVLGLPRPEHLYVLAGASSPIRVEQAGERAIVLRPERGFLYTPLERHYRKGPLEVGDRVDLSSVSAEVVETKDGRPSAVRFELGTDGKAPLLLTWERGRFQPLTWKNGRATLPEEDFGKILLETALGVK